jgi:hypothetical protein
VDVFESGGAWDENVDVGGTTWHVGNSEGSDAGGRTASPDRQEYREAEERPIATPLSQQMRAAAEKELDTASQRRKEKQMRWEAELQAELEYQQSLG